MVGADAESVGWSIELIRSQVWIGRVNRRFQDVPAEYRHCFRNAPLDALSGLVSQERRCFVEVFACRTQGRVQPFGGVPIESVHVRHPECVI